MEIKFAKKDFWLSVLAGEIVAWLSLPTLENLKILGILSGFGVNLTLFFIFWAIFVPISAVIGLKFFHLIAKIKQSVGFWELGKYGVIGVLNTFFNAGIYNLFIYLTNVSSGLSLDLFFIIAFTITVVNSFLWNKFWSFEEKSIENIKTEAIQFFIISAAVALINAVILHVIVNVIGAPVGIEPKIWANVALGFTIITAFLGNFFSYKYLVFFNKQ